MKRNAWPLLPGTMVAVSLETTELNPLHNRITEVGAVCFDYEGNLLDTFWDRANPDIPIPEHIRKITGVTDEKVAGPGPPEEVVRDFFVWAGSEHGSRRTAERPSPLGDYRKCS